MLLGVIVVDMIQTHKVGTHELKRVDQSFCTSMGKIDITPHYRCVKCNQTAPDLHSSTWERETCREYLQKQETLDISSTNPARQKRLKNISFEELVENVNDPIEFLERRSVTIDTHFGSPPRDWSEMEYEPITKETEHNSLIKSMVSTILST